MKRLILFFSVYSILTFCLLPSLLAQQDWQWKNPFPQGNILRGSASPDSSTIIMVGDAGTILKSKDGGTSWQKQESGTEQDLYAISVLGPNCAFAVGTDGTIIRSKDCGQTWDHLNSGRKDTLRGVSVLSNQRIIAVGDTGTILKSIDGGDSWIYEPIGDYNSNINSVFFENGGNGFGGFVGDSNRINFGGPPIYTSGDSFGTFNQYGGNFPNLAGKSLNGLHIDKADPNKAVLVGEKGLILNTHDGGLSWNAPQTGSTVSINGVKFFDAQNGFAYGPDGLLLRTKDCGDTWSVVPIPIQRDIITMIFPKDSTSVFGGGGGLIYRSPDGGSSFEPLQTGFFNNLADVTFLDDSFGIAVGTFGTVLRTANGGDNWTQSLQVTTDPMESVTAVDGKAWIAGGKFGTFGRIYFSGDTGVSWFPQPVFALSKFFDITFIDSLRGFAVGLSGTMFCTKDGGATWTPKNSGTTNWLLDITMTDDTTAYAAGGFGTLIKTTDFGDNWTPQSIGTQEWLTAVTFLDDSFGIACGNHGVIFRTKDGGQSWEDKSPPNINFDFTDISLFRGLITANKNGEKEIGVTAVGYGGTIMYSPDFGDSWNQQYSKTNYPLTACFFNDSAQGTAVGHFGTILQTDTFVLVNTTAIEEPFEELIQYRFLQEVYPNPFSDLCKINFQVPYQAPVDLRIYNTTGQLVERLLNQSFVPGFYTIEWQNQGLSQGVYYCRLQIGQYSETMKLLKGP